MDSGHVKHQTRNIAWQTKTQYDESKVPYQLCRIRKGGARCSTAKISPVKKHIHLSLASMIILSDFMAAHMFKPFCQVSSDSKPVKIA